MIKILGQDSSINKEITCKNCATRLQYNPVDERHDYSTDYTGCKDTYSYLTCLCCGQKVITRNW